MGGQKEKKMNRFQLRHFFVHGLLCCSITACAFHETKEEPSVVDSSSDQGLQLVSDDPAIRCLKARVDQGDARAAFVIAELYGSTEPKTTSSEWIKKSADMGYRPARHLIAAQHYGSDDLCARNQAIQEFNALADEDIPEAAHSTKLIAGVIANSEKTEGVPGVVSNMEIGTPKWCAKADNRVDPICVEEANKTELFNHCSSGNSNWKTLALSYKSLDIVFDPAISDRGPLQKCLIYPLPNNDKLPEFQGKPAAVSEKVVRCLERKFSSGDAKAAFALYQVFAAAHDSAKTTEWLHLSAEGGYKPAQLEIAERDLAININNDRQKGIQELTKLAEDNYRPAAMSLSYVYENPVADIIRIFDESQYADSVFRSDQRPMRKSAKALELQRLSESWELRAEKMPEPDYEREEKIISGLITSCKGKSVQSQK